MSRAAVYRPHLRSKVQAILSKAKTAFSTEDTREGTSRPSFVVKLQPKLTRIAATKSTRDLVITKSRSIESNSRAAIQVDERSFVQPKIWPAPQ